jgi:hypothetical protein
MEMQKPARIKIYVTHHDVVVNETCETNLNGHGSDSHQFDFRILWKSFLFTIVPTYTNIKKSRMFYILKHHKELLIRIITCCRHAFFVYPES